jgi:hypothetical protein
VNRKVLLWLAAAAALALLVAYQTVGSSAARHSAEYAASADVPTVQPGTDVLSGIAVVPLRQHRYDYLRAAFGDAWDDNNDAPLGRNGCDTRDDLRVDQAVPGRRGHRHAARPIHQQNHRLSARP